MKQFLSASDIARTLEVKTSTVTRWIQKGMFGSVVSMKGFRAGPRAKWRIPLGAYQDFINEQKIK